MPQFSTRRRVRHSADDMFDLVADIERYPEFVPLCRAMRVVRRTQLADREIVVAEMQVKFLAPARLDDVLHADITAFTRRSASMRFAQCILRPADGALLIEADVRAACIDAARYKPRRIPDSLLSEFVPHE